MEVKALIIHFSVHKGYSEDRKPKRGPKFKFSTKDELHLVAYTNYCWEQNAPRTQEMLKPEIVHYMQVQRITNTFKHGEPGKV